MCCVKMQKRVNADFHKTQYFLFFKNFYKINDLCILPISSGTAGPIWLNFFLLAPSWSRDGFRPKKIPDAGSGFSVNPEKP